MTDQHRQALYALISTASDASAKVFERQGRLLPMFHACAADGERLIFAAEELLMHFAI